MLGLFLKLGEQGNIAVMPLFRYVMPLNRLNYAASVFSEMGAFRVSAGPYVLVKFGKGRRQFFKLKEVKAREVEQAEAGRIYQRTAPGKPKLRMACGMPPPVRFTETLTL